MATAAELSVWAERILQSLDETTISSTRLVTWLQTNLYRINLAVGSGYYLEDNGSILPAMSAPISGLYEEIYYCDYLNKKANALVGAFAYDWTEIEGDKQGKIRRVSKNEGAKTYTIMAKDCQTRLKDLIRWYNSQFNDSIMCAGQVLYGDRGEVADTGLRNYNYPPDGYYSSTNTTWDNS